MELRLLLAFVLTGLVLFITPLVVKRPVQTPSGKPEAKPAPATQPQQAAEPTAVAAPAETASPGQVAAARDEAVTLETDVYRIEFSNRGAVVRSWTLKKYTDYAGKPLELVNAQARPKVYYPFTVDLRDKPLASTLNHQALYRIRRSDDGLGVDFDWSDGKTTARKSFRFRRDSYLSEVASEVTQNGTGLPHTLLWRGGFGDAYASNAAASQQAVFYDTGAGKLVKHAADEAKAGVVTNAGAYTFAGVEDAYFAAVFLPRDGGRIEHQTWRDEVPTVAATKDEPHVGVGVGGEARNRFTLFVGPKDLDLLKRIDPKLAGLVDFGWFSFLARPLFAVLNWLNNGYVHNYGWSIVLVTVAINMLLLPLKFHGMKEMKKMSAIQPHIQAIQAKYKGLKATDPRRMEMQQEMSALYKQHGVNPLGGGCLPLLLQMPFFFAFLAVLQTAIEMRGARFLWVTDLSQPETIPIRILPLLMVASGFLQQKMTPATSADPAQQRMLMIMPLMFGFMFYYSSSGLVLYWLTGNIVGIIQQWFFNRLGVSGSAAPASGAVLDAKPVGGGPKRKSR